MLDFQQAYASLLQPHPGPRIGERNRTPLHLRGHYVGWQSCDARPARHPQSRSPRYKHQVVDAHRRPARDLKAQRREEGRCRQGDGNFTGRTIAAVNAIASEVANIQLRLYQVEGDDHKELDDHPLLTLLQGVNEQMTGIGLKYVTMAHLEL